jgi:hypothetical protein
MSVAYEYIPEYGIEPFKTPTGAIETEENLVITQWETQSFEFDPFSIVLGDILVPYPNSGQPPTNQVNGWQSAMRSRYSARFYLDLNDASEFPAFILAVLNPPQELRQQFAVAGANLPPGEDPDDDDDYIIKRSVQGSYGWEARFLDAAAFGQTDLTPENAPITALSSSFLPGKGIWLPLLKTNGANGTPPEFFDVSTPAAVNNMIKTIENGGDLYVAIIYGAAPPPESRTWNIEFRWPHSAARG